jgi:Uma2 family endonuclease
MMRLADAPLPGTTVDPRYPDTNGRFMGDTDYHSIAISGLREGLEDHFADVPDVYVATNIVWYYKRGDARCRRDPDVLVAKGVGKHRRRSFRSWEEKCVPRTLFEIASRRTWRRDLGNKRELYERLKVKEYFVFDAEGCYLNPVFRGWELVRGLYVPLVASADGSLLSKEIGLRFRPEGATLRFVDPNTGRSIPTRRERIEEEEERNERSRQEIARLRARLARYENGER